MHWPLPAAYSLPLASPKREHNKIIRLTATNECQYKAMHLARAPLAGQINISLQVFTIFRGGRTTVVILITLWVANLHICSANPSFVVLQI